MHFTQNVKICEAKDTQEPTIIGKGFNTYLSEMERSREQ